MKASKFTDVQKAFTLNQGEDGMPVAEIFRKAGISQATYFSWKKRYDGHCHGNQVATSTCKELVEYHAPMAADRQWSMASARWLRCVGREIRWRWVLEAL